MTPLTAGEALEQVRALHEPVDLECACHGSYQCPNSTTVCPTCQVDWPCREVAILDAVTPPTPVTVETLEQSRNLPDGTLLRLAPTPGGGPSYGVLEVHNSPKGKFAIVNSYGTPWEDIPERYFPAIVLTPATPATPATPEHAEQERGRGSRGEPADDPRAHDNIGSESDATRLAASLKRAATTTEQAGPVAHG